VVHYNETFIILPMKSGGPGWSWTNDQAYSGGTPVRLYFDLRLNGNCKPVCSRFLNPSDIHYYRNGLAHWQRRDGQGSYRFSANYGNALHPLSGASRYRLEPVMGSVLRIDTQNINPPTFS